MRIPLSGRRRNLLERVIINFGRRFRLPPWRDRNDRFLFHPYRLNATCNLVETHHNKKRTAEILNMGRRTLYYKMEKYGISLSK